MRRLLILVLALVPFFVNAQVLRNRGPLYAEDFGIKGDSTDETAKLQAAINYAAQLNGKTLRLRIGKYLINANLLLTSNITIEGEGEGTELIFTNGSSSPRYMFQGDAAAYSSITFKDLKINCNRAGNTGAQIWGVKLNNATKVKFERVTFVGSKGTANVRLFNCSDVDILNCRFDNDGAHAIQLYGGSNINIIKNRISNWAQLDSTKCAISGYVNPVNNVKIQFNDLYNSNGEQFAIETAGAYMTDWNISHNFFNDVQLGGSGISGQFVNSNINWNHMINGSGSQRSGIEISGKGVKAIGNEIDGGNIIVNGLTNLAGFPGNGKGFYIALNKVKTRGVNNGGIHIAGKDSVAVEDVDILFNTVNTTEATGNSSAMFVGTYGLPGKVKNVRYIGNKVYSMGYGFRMQAMSGSSDIQLVDNEIYAGSYWIGYLTDSFTNVKIRNNKSYIAKGDTIQYVVSATDPIIDLAVTEQFIEPNDANFTIPNGSGNLTVNYYNSLTADRTVTLPDPSKNKGRKFTIRNGSATFNINLSATVYENASTTYNIITPGQTLTFYPNGTTFRRIQ